MKPSASPTPIGGAKSVSPTLLRSNSSVFGSQGGQMPPQATLSSHVSPQTHTLLNQSFGNGCSNSGLSGLGGVQCGGVDSTVGSYPLLFVTNNVRVAPSPAAFASSSTGNSGSYSQIQNQKTSNTSGKQIFPEQQQSQIQQFEQQKFQHSQQFSITQNQMQQHQLQQSQHPFQSARAGLGVVGAINLEPQTLNEQMCSQQQLESLQNLGPVQLESQQNQFCRGMGPVRFESQHSDQAIFLEQQLLQRSRQRPQVTAAPMNRLQQQCNLQLQQQHQQQPMKLLPQQQPQLHLPIRSAVRPLYQSGMCARRLTEYMFRQRCRPEDNNIEFWRKFVVEFFAPSAKKRWCVSLYGNSRQSNGVSHQDIWHCEICNRKPSCGIETTVEVLPRLLKMKYDSGTLEELLCVDMPHEYQNAYGQIVIHYARAIHESVFEHFRVVRDGQLRIIFSQELKIFSWEFCVRRHEELISRRLIIPQVIQLEAAAHNYQASAQNAISNSSSPDLHSNCNMLAASAHQLEKALEVPFVNDLGYPKKYLRCIQIADVVNSMRDLIYYCQMTGKGPMESLANFPRWRHNSGQRLDEQQQIAGQNLNNDHPVQASAVQISASNGVASVNDFRGTTASTTNTVGLLHQNSINSQHDNQMNNPNGPYPGTPLRIPSAGSSTTPPQTQPNPSSPTPSSSNNPPQTCHNALTAQIPQQQPSQSNESLSCVKKIIKELRSSSRFSGADSMVNVLPQVSHSSLNSSNCQAGNGIVNNNLGSGSFENKGTGISPSATVNGIRAATSNNSSSTSCRRAGKPNHQQQE